ncbi:hypothetical protein ACVOMV_19075 [Mesorhizobium atlanticum]
MAPGVFVIVEAMHPRVVVRRMDDLHVGHGPLLRLVPALSPDLAGGAADRRPHRCSTASPTWCTLPRPSGGSLRGRQAPTLPPGRPSMPSARPATASWTMTVGDARASRAVPLLACSKAARC